MSDALPFNRPGLPILGQACHVEGWYPSVLIVCHCDARTPLLIVGLAAVATCPACQRSFGIAELGHDGATGQGKVVVSTVPSPVGVS